VFVSLSTFACTYIYVSSSERFLFAATTTAVQDTKSSEMSNKTTFKGRLESPSISATEGKGFLRGILERERG
jgi:hypothetical protein